MQQTDDYWRGKTALVTGATGLVGSWLCAELAASGARVVGLVRDQVPRSNLYSMGTDRVIDIARGDVCDYETVLRVMNEYEVDTVFHLAAQTIVGIANRAPLSTFEANIKGTWTLLEAARLSPRVERVVMASSDKAYGTQEDLPYREDAPLVGLHPYDASKSCADLIAQTYYHSFGMPVGVSRCGNIFGGGDLNFNRIFPETMLAVWENRRPIIRSDGTPTRDYLYVGDVVWAYLALARAQDTPALRGRAYNFSYEMPRTVAEIVTEITHVLGRPDLEPDIRGDGIPAGEIPHQYLAADRARNELGWMPRFGLEDGIRATWDWYVNLFGKMQSEHVTRG